MAMCTEQDVAFGVAEFLTAGSEKVCEKFVTLFDFSEKEKSLSWGDQVELALGEDSEGEQKVTEKNLNESEDVTKISARKQRRIPQRRQKVIPEKQQKIIPERQQKRIFERQQKRIFERQQREMPVPERQHRHFPINPTNSILVRNISPKTTKECLLDLFEKFGKIHSVDFRSIRRPDSDTSESATIKNNVDAVIKFENSDDAKRAQKLNGYKINGSTIMINYVDSDSHYDDKRSIYVANIPFEVEEGAVEEYFSNCGDVESVRIPRDALSGSGRGFGFVKFKSEDSVAAALQQNNTKFGGRPLKISRIRPQKNFKKYSGIRNNNRSEDTVKVLPVKRRIFKRSDSGNDKSDKKDKVRVPLKRQRR